MIGHSLLSTCRLARSPELLCLCQIQHMPLSPSTYSVVFWNDVDLRSSPFELDSQSVPLSWIYSLPYSLHREFQGWQWGDYPEEILGEWEAVFWASAGWHPVWLRAGLPRCGGEWRGALPADDRPAGQLRGPQRHGLQNGHQVGCQYGELVEEKCLFISSCCVTYCYYFLLVFGISPALFSYNRVNMGRWVPCGF